MGDGEVCPAQVIAMTTLNLSAAQMESSTRMIAIGENAPAEQVKFIYSEKIKMEGGRREVCK